MTTHESISDKIENLLACKFQHFDGGFRIDLPCVITDNHTLYVQDLYDLVDFLDNGGFYIRTVRFCNAYLKGYQVTLVLLDLKTGELLKRSHRINNETIPCNWVLTQDDVVKSKSEPEKDVINDSHDSN